MLEGRGLAFNSWMAGGGGLALRVPQALNAGIAVEHMYTSLNSLKGVIKGII